MEIKILLYDNENYTEYSFENELQKELSKLDRKVMSVKTTKETRRVIFRKKEIIVVDVEIDGKEVTDPDEFNDTISRAVLQAADNLTLELYGIE